MDDRGLRDVARERKTLSLTDYPAGRLSGVARREMRVRVRCLSPIEFQVTRGTRSYLDRSASSDVGDGTIVNVDVRLTAGGTDRDE